MVNYVIILERFPSFNSNCMIEGPVDMKDPGGSKTQCGSSLDHFTNSTVFTLTCTVHLQKRMGCTVISKLMWPWNLFLQEHDLGSAFFGPHFRLQGLRAGKGSEAAAPTQQWVFIG